MSESSDPVSRERDAVLSPKAIWWSAAVLLAAGIGVAVWLLLVYGQGGDTKRTQLDAIKTAGTIVIGTRAVLRRCCWLLGGNAPPKRILW